MGEEARRRGKSLDVRIERGDCWTVGKGDRRGDDDDVEEGLVGIREEKVLEGLLRVVYRR